MEVILLESVEKYINALSSSTERCQVVRYLERQGQLAFVLREPVSKKLSHGINEIRPGPHRLLFFYHSGSIVVLRAFRKKSRSAPDWEIMSAVKIRNQYLMKEN